MGRLEEEDGEGPSSIPHLGKFEWYLGLHDFETPIGLTPRPKLQCPYLSKADLPTGENSNSFLPACPLEPNGCEDLTRFHTQYLICPSWKAGV